MSLPCFFMQKNTQQSVTQWWSINTNSLYKIHIKCFQLMSKSRAHFAHFLLLSSLFPIPLAVPHYLFLILSLLLPASHVSCLSWYVLLYCFLTLFVIFVCSLGDWLGLFPTVKGWHYLTVSSHFHMWWCWFKHRVTREVMHIHTCADKLLLFEFYCLFNHLWN